VAGYTPRWYARPKTVTHPSINLPIMRRPGIELTTTELHVRRPLSAIDYRARWVMYWWKL